MHAGDMAVAKVWATLGYLGLPWATSASPGRGRLTSVSPGQLVREAEARAGVTGRASGPGAPQICISIE